MAKIRAEVGETKTLIIKSIKEAAYTFASHKKRHIGQMRVKIIKHILLALGLSLSLYSANGQTSAESLNETINDYQKFISGLKNGHCAMYPSCSNYGKLVFHNNNVLKAFPLMCDRLVRCSHDGEHYKSTYVRGFRSYVDFPPNTSDINISLYQEITPRAVSLKFTPSSDTVAFVVKRLINEHSYECALIEIERAKLLRGSLSADLVECKMKCLRALNRQADALFEYATLQDSLKNTPNLLLQSAMAHYELKDYSSSLSIITNCNANSSEFTTAISPLEAINSIRLGDYNTAYSYWLKAKECGAPNIDECILLTDKITKSKNEKNPRVARALSIVVPGLGYLYSGHKGSFISSLAMNALMGYATYTSLKSENYGVMALCGFLSLSFYVGSIGGSGRAAIRYNESKTEKMLNKIESLTISYY
ncbi:MAG: membrane protein insertion efficiency factor YidD [Bacteroidales bacterium]|nr:membrane protein insertion efficiency factor YidD [Bacteroidales bacterium]